VDEEDLIRRPPLLPSVAGLLRGEILVSFAVLLLSSVAISAQQMEIYKYTGAPFNVALCQSQQSGSGETCPAGNLTMLATFNLPPASFNSPTPVQLTPVSITTSALGIIRTFAPISIDTLTFQNGAVISSVIETPTFTPEYVESLYGPQFSGTFADAVRNESADSYGTTNVQGVWTLLPTLLDPVPNLLNGATVQSTPNVLSGRPVTGAGADGVTQVVVQVPAQNLGDQITLTLMNDQGTQSSNPNEDGALGNPGDLTFSQSKITVTAQDTPAGPMGFAIYRAPLDFARLSAPGMYMTGTCGSKTTTDDQLACRAVSLQIQLPSGSPSTTPITILRPPVVLVHGLWDSPAGWNNSAPLYQNGFWDCPSTGSCPTPGTCLNRFCGALADYSTPITVLSSNPAYLSTSKARANTLGLQYNAPTVLTEIQNAVNQFKLGQNTQGIQAAGVQADIVAHSLGGLITRTLPLLPTFLSNTTFAEGVVHKLITIDTPHLGSPVAADFLSTQCARYLLASAGNFAFLSATIPQGTFSGAVGDLQGNGFGGNLSPALQTIANSGSHPLPTALTYGIAETNNFSSLATNNTSRALHNICGTLFGEPVAQRLTPTGWPTEFGQDSDGIVPEASELNNSLNLSAATLADGYVHSGGLEMLGMTGPSVLPTVSDLSQFGEPQIQLVPNAVIQLLNTPVYSSAYQPLNP
jgi:pimeloyl-ACP methyl ester carboxylesterase